jgi:hypothetical protein
MFMFLTLSVSAQMAGMKAAPSANAYPYDFSDKYYSNQGVSPYDIIGRRTGTDGMSVFDKLVGPNYSDVRVLVTVPAYNQFGEPIFWSPLGEFQFRGFTNDKAGVMARHTAQMYRMYIFPDSKIAEFSAFAMNRQAPIFDNSRAVSNRRDANPLGLREVFVVTFTEKAFSKDGIEIMTYFAKKNGLAADDTPIIRNADDLAFLEKNGFVDVITSASGDFAPYMPEYAIAPEITAKGAIAPDAFLWMTMKDGTPLPAEHMFYDMFNCMKKTGDMCAE